MALEDSFKLNPGDALEYLYSEGLHGSVELLGWLLVRSGAGEHCADRLWEAMGDAQRADQNYRSAIDMYRTAAAQSSGAREQALRLQKKIAKCYVALGEKASALAMLRPGGVVSTPDELDIEAHLLLGRLYLDAKNLQAARECFREVLRRAPLAVEAAVLLKECGGTLDPDALTLMTASMGVPDTVAATLGEYLDGVSKMYAGNYGAARDLFSSASSTVKDCAPLDVRLAEAEHELLTSQGKYDAAERSMRAFERARRSDRWMTRSMDDYSALLMQAGRGSELTTVCDALLKVDPLAPATWRSAAILCKLYHLRERGETLDAHLSNVRERSAKQLRNPALVLPSEQISMAEVQLRSGQIEEARATLKDAMRRAPESALVYAAYAKVMVAMERPHRAIEAYQTALKLSPQCVDAAVELARLYVEEEGVEEAVELIDDFISRCETSSTQWLRFAVTRARVELVSVLGERGMYDEAMRHLDKAIIADGESELVRVCFDDLMSVMQAMGDDNTDSDARDTALTPPRSRSRALELNELDSPDL